MEAKLFINDHDVVECGCDAAALYGECRHTRPEVVISWLVQRVQAAEAKLVTFAEELEALQAQLGETGAIPDSIQEAFNSGNGSYREKK